jgi:2-C-methyl-D-erythritol 4-phosphate cytidylyltransferase
LFFYVTYFIASMKKIVIIVAGGLGKRMKSDIPKQFILLCGKPILMHTFLKFYYYDPQIEFRLVLPQQAFETWNELCLQYDFRIAHKLFPGGETRFHSVKNGLTGISESTIIGIHDAVRPLVSLNTIKNCFDLASKKGSAIPVLPLTESVREISNNHSIARQRESYRSVQTPQVFKSEILLKSYETEYITSFTDDASVVENSGYPIYLTDGNEENIKLTTPIDLLIGEAFMQQTTL